MYKKYTLFNTVDVTLTYVNVAFWGAPEGNPVVRFAIANLGVGLGLVTCAVIAQVLVWYLSRRARFVAAIAATIHAIMALTWMIFTIQVVIGVSQW